MKYVKTYEEFDWHAFSTYAPLVGAAVGHLIAKYGGKYLINKNKKEYFKKSMQDDLYTRGRWQIKEEGNEISINKKMYNGDIKPRYIINKETREFKFISDTYPIIIKLSTSDLNNMINDLNWVNEVSESIEDCFHDLRDEGFEVELNATDFVKRGIVVLIHLKSDSDDYFGDNKFQLIDCLEQVKDIINKIEGMYGVKIDDTYKDPLRHHPVGEVILKSSDITNLEKNDINLLKQDNERAKEVGNTLMNVKDYRLFNIRTLLIPFKKL